MLSDVLPEMELFLKFHHLMWNKLMKMNSSRQVGVGQDCLLSWTVPQRKLKKTKKKKVWTDVLPEMELFHDMRNQFIKMNSFGQAGVGLDCLYSLGLFIRENYITSIIITYSLAGKQLKLKYTLGANKELGRRGGGGGGRGRGGREGQGHTPTLGIAFLHLAPNSARFGYPTEGHSLYGYATEGHPLYGYATEGHSLYGYATEGHSLYGYATEGHPLYGYATEAHALYPHSCPLMQSAPSERLGY